MTYLDAIILGVVQALTEFLPVSSSGHLVLAQALFSIQPNSGIAFEVMVHFGTLFSVMYCYRNELLNLLKSLNASSGQGNEVGRAEGISELLRLFVGCLPAGVIGLTFKDELEATFGSPTFVCFALMATGVLLFSTQMSRDKNRQITVTLAFLIGLAQAIAILPGVSRAGSTIAMAMWLGVSNARAAQFSFFLSIPVIAGASLLQIRSLLQDDAVTTEWSLLLTAALCAFVVGVLALRLLLVLLDRGVFARFGWYCVGVGALGISLL